MEDIREIRGEKKRLRSEIRRKRRELGASCRKEADAAIVKRLEDLKAYRQARTVFCYVSVADEVDTGELIRNMLTAGKRVAVPRCGACGEEDPPGTEKGRMEAYEITSLDDLEPGMYGIPEPKEYCRRILPTEIDLCIVPCLCVGSDGTRLGYGGGYYDRYLIRMRPDAVCAALCRENTQGAEPPAEPHDRPVDMAVTENRVIVYRPDLADHINFYEFIK